MPTATLPDVAPAHTDDDDDDLTHTWCNWCERVPRRAICGKDITNTPQARPGQKVDCPRCLELEMMHLEVLHGV